MGCGRRRGGGRQRYAGGLGVTCRDPPISAADHDAEVVDGRRREAERTPTAAGRRVTAALGRVETDRVRRDKPNRGPKSHVRLPVGLYGVSGPPTRCCPNAAGRPALALAACGLDFLVSPIRRLAHARDSRRPELTSRALDSPDITGPKPGPSLHQDVKQWPSCITLGSTSRFALAA